jgi:hypothetical protein
VKYDKIFSGDNMQKLYDTDRTPACCICRYGKSAPGGDGVLCVKKGIMMPDSSCRHFRYDPLKRVPQRRPDAESSFDPEDFKI